MTGQRALIISLGELKDTIYTLPLISVLRQNDYEVEVLTAEKGFEVVNKNPMINRVHLAPLEQWLNKLPYMGIFEDVSECTKRLQKRNFDIAIDCQQTFRSLILFAKCGAKRRLTYSNAKEFSSLGGNENIDSKPDFRNTNIHKVELNLNFARYLGLNTKSAEFILPEMKYTSKTKIDKFLKFSEERPIIVLSPNMKNGELAWHPKNWINLVNNISDKFNILVIGDAHDNVLANKLSHKNLVNLCGKTTFEDLRYIFSIAHIIISNNIENSVIAWADKKNVVTISTNMPPQKFNPYTLNKGNTYKTLIGNLDCQPCGQKYCAHSTFKCSHYPTVESVLNCIK